MSRNYVAKFSIRLDPPPDFGGLNRLLHFATYFWGATLVSDPKTRDISPDRENRGIVRRRTLLVRRTIKFRRLTKILRKRAVFERKPYLLAYSTARVSLITVTRICPGNVSDSSIFLAMSRLSKVESSSEILSLSTITLSSLPA